MNLYNICVWCVLLSMAFVMFAALWVYPCNISPVLAKVIGGWTLCAVAFVMALEYLEARRNK